MNSALSAAETSEPRVGQAPLAEPSPHAPALVVQGLTAGYGAGAVITGVDLTVQAGEVVAVLGRNGVGKTSTLLAIAGVLPATEGNIEFPSAEGDRRRAVLVPDDRGLFTSLTVREHLRLARSVTDEPEERALDWFPQLRGLIDRSAGLLSGGEAQQLALACALTRRPTLLMVDELSLGLAPKVVADLFPLVASVAKDTGCGVVLVEQFVNLVLTVADRAVVMNDGRIAWDAPAAEVGADRARLESLYLN